jgi:UDP-GlcNAc:undecaprenyl-phosphate/decaprenyl-phosphate GlcNAc-1-phosphate transferase
VALLASVTMTVPVRRLALHIGMVDHPGPRKIHAAPMPLLGGLAIYAGFVLAILVAIHGPTSAQMAGILTGATLLAVVGVLDDRGLLHHQVKLFGAMPCAALILLITGIRAQVFSPFVAGTAGWLLDGALTVLWVVGITAAFSILDHIDGLCAGIAAVAASFFTLTAVFTGQLLVGTLSAAVLGASLGFVLWNFNPAKIFMGDGGAMLLGFLMATLGLKIRPESVNPSANWLVPVLILGVPIFDTTLVSISRGRRGLLPFTSPGKDHTAHRLANLGLRTKGAVLSLYALGGVFGGLAVIVMRVPIRHAHSFAAGAAAIMAVAILLLERAPYERQQKASREFARR